MLLLLTLSCQQSPTYLVFDKEEPGIDPKVFAEHLLYEDSAYVGYCSFDSERNELFYAVTNQQWDISHILWMNAKGETDTLKLNIDALWMGEPRLSPDNERLYFTAILQPEDNTEWHADFFYSDRTEMGWSKPRKFAQNSDQSEWHISFTHTNTAYFASELDGSRLKADIYYSEFENGEYKEAIKLPAGINSEYNDSDPLIAHDESFLIFHSDRPGGFGQHDLYISFKQGDKWSDPVNMGERVNTPEWEMGPSLSPDGKYLFFTRRESWNTAVPSKIYWVDTKVIKTLESQ